MRVITILCSFVLLTLLPSAATGKAVIAVGTYDGLDHVLAENDSLNFERTDLGTAGYKTTMIAVGDIDGDGDQDIVAAREGSTMRVYEKNATDGYAEARIIDSSLSGVEVLALGDIDGDGDLDLVPNRGGVPYINDGTGFFTAGSNPIPVAVDLHLKDLDGDGDLDLVTLEVNSSISPVYFTGQDIVVYSNNGAGVFTETYREVALIQQTNPPNPLYLDGHSYHQLVVGDGDGDGDSDIYAYRSNYVCNLTIPPPPCTSESELIPFLNNGSNQFTSEASVYTGSTPNLTIGDLNNDGDLDLLIGGLSQISWGRNEGNGLSFDFQNYLTGVHAHGITQIESGDVDGDGNNDVIAGSYLYTGTSRTINVTILYLDNIGNINSSEGFNTLESNTSYISSIKLYHRFNVTIDGDGLPDHLMNYLKQGTNGFVPAANFVNGFSQPRVYEPVIPEITAPVVIEDELNNCYYKLISWYGSGLEDDAGSPDASLGEDDLLRIPITGDSAITWVYEKVIKFEVLTETEGLSQECAGDGITGEDCVNADPCSESSVYGMACTVSSETRFYPENTSIVLTTLKDISTTECSSWVYIGLDRICEEYVTEQKSCGGLNPVSGNKPIGAPVIINDRMVSSLFLTKNTKVLWNYSDADAAEVGSALSPPSEVSDCGACTVDTATRPNIHILFKDQVDTTDENGFYWSEEEGTLYLSRPVALFEINWPLTGDNCACDTAKTMAYATWPEPVQRHIAGSPANVNAGANEYEFKKVLFSEQMEAETAVAAGVFKPVKAGRNVLLFSSDAEPVNILVVETVSLDEALGDTEDTACAIGEEITGNVYLHSEPEDKNGFIYHETSVYDGAGSSRAHDRATRTGPILPVNVTGADTAEENQMVVVWYEQDTDLGIGWPANPVRYRCAWPGTPDTIYIAEQDSAEPLGEFEQEGMVYYQPDPELAGFNPNEEHALKIGEYVYALSNELNEVENFSDPYVLLKYRDAAEQWRMKVFKVEVSNNPDPESYFHYGVNAGSPIIAPVPLSLLPAAPKTHISGGAPFYLRDHKGGHWAKSAGTGNEPAEITMQMYYPLLDSFYYPADFVHNNGTAVVTGDSIPLLNGGANHTDEATEAIFTVSWPANAPELYVGETLMGAKYGLPDLVNMASAQVIFDEELYQGKRPLVKLYAPLAERKVVLDAVPATIKTENVAGKIIFPELVYSLKSRLSYDLVNKKLIFKGVLDDKGLGEALLLTNIITEAEKVLLLAFGGGDTDWHTAIADLFALCRAPEDVDASLKFSPSFLQNPPYVTGDTIEDHWGIQLGLGEEYDPSELSQSQLDPETYPPEDLQLYLGPQKIMGQKMALTAGMAQGEGWVVVAENNDPALGAAPVQLHIILVGQGPYRGEVKVITSDNVFDEKLTLRHTGDFAGEPGNLYFQWFYKPDTNGIPPLFPESQEKLEADGWLPLENGQGWGKLDTIIEGVSPLTLSDNWIMVRYYHGYAYPQLEPELGVVEPTDTPVFDNTAADWSGWAGGPGNESAQLAEGWIKRVFDSLNLLETRVTDFLNNPTNTLVSMIAQLGERYEGAIALNSSAENLNQMGMIEAYETILYRGMQFSVDNGINYGPANNALLLAATKLADFYTLLGNEAYADAIDPTIGFDTQAGEFGAMMPSIFSFQNQLDSLLDEELILLRGRDDDMSTTRAQPIYNRLIWNFTRDIGEVAYATCYNITDMDNSGVINEYDAQYMYPQGHGDAWGHYLHGMSYWYYLLNHDYFTWEPRIEAVLVGGAPVPVDYLDERKFARTAAIKARVGAEVVNMTYRKHYVDDPAGQWQGYKDTEPTRAWGVDGWARRAGQGALFDWMVAHSLLPHQDPNPAHEGINKIDRTTVEELAEIASAFSDIQARINESDKGLNPVGLAKGVVPFDIDPSLVDSGETHFEQIHARAVKALNNAGTVFEHANNYTRMLRQNEESLDDFKNSLEDQERDYLNRLIELFGYPYEGDIGPSGFYSDGYDGPDWLHFMYMDLPDLTGRISAEDGNQIKDYTAEWDLEEWDWDEELDITGGPRTVSYPFAENDVWFSKPSDWGERRAPGEIQMALSDVIQADMAFELGMIEYNNAIDDIEGAKEALETRYNVLASQIQVMELTTEVYIGADAAIGLLHIAQGALDITGLMTIGTFEAFDQALPEMVGMATDVAAPIRGAMYAAQVATSVAEKSLEVGMSLTMTAAEMSKEWAGRAEEYQLTVIDARYEVQQLIGEMEGSVNAAVIKQHDLYMLREVLHQATGRYMAAVAKAQRLLQERAAIRARAAAEVQEYRYQDLGFRVFRNDALQKYRASFDLAARYVYLAASAYDYETNLLGSDQGSGSAFLTDIVKQRALGAISDGAPIAGTPGLADPLARLDQNFDVYKGQLGFNNPQTETNRFSLRNEWFRIGEADNGASDENWRNTLRGFWKTDLWDVPEFNRYCRPFAPEYMGAQPGLVIPFKTMVEFGKNYFGWPLSGGDSSYDPTNFATKIRSVGVWFSDYDGTGLSNTPRIYLVPVGVDVLRSPSGDGFLKRAWQVVDQKLPVPFPVGALDLTNDSWIPINDSLSGDMAEIRRFSSFRAYHDSGFFVEDETISDSRLIGRSVWNTEWMLIIPGGTLLYDQDEGLEKFINSVTDIKLFFQTYSYSGN